MATRSVYCPVLRRAVRIASTRSPRHRDGHATIPDDPRLVCLDYSDPCEQEVEGVLDGYLRICPVFGVPAAVMGVERVRAGLCPGRRVLVRAGCTACGRRTDHERVGRSLGICVACGSTNRTRIEVGRT